MGERRASENAGMKTLTIMIALLALAACRQEGPAEKAGRQLDQAGDKAARSIEKAGENVRDAVNGKK
jgi:predicted small lipoprotein YifL